MEKTKGFFIHDWMTQKLDLRGPDLMVYAIIYGFTQGGNSDFWGTCDYLSKMTGYCKNTMSGSLNRLTECGYIKKIRRKGTTNVYTANLGLTEPVHATKMSSGYLTNAEINAIPYDYERTDFQSDQLEPLPTTNTQTKVTEQIEQTETPYVSVYDKEKTKKDLKTLMRWTRTIAEPTEVDVLIKWLNLMYANKKVMTLETYSDKVKGLYTKTKECGLSALAVVEDTLEKGYFSFQYSIDALRKKQYNNQRNPEQTVIRKQTEDKSFFSDEVF